MSCLFSGVADCRLEGGVFLLSLVWVGILLFQLVFGCDITDFSFGGNSLSMMELLESDEVLEMRALLFFYLFIFYLAFLYRRTRQTHGLVSPCFTC